MAIQSALNGKFPAGAVRECYLMPNMNYATALVSSIGHVQLH